MGKLAAADTCWDSVQAAQEMACRLRVERGWNAHQNLNVTPHRVSLLTFSAFSTPCVGTPCVLLMRCCDAAHQMLLDMSVHGAMPHLCYVHAA
jgi:hypothetical protein